MAVVAVTVLSESDQAVLVTAAYNGTLAATVAERNLHPARVQLTRRQNETFAQALDDAEDWQAILLAEHLSQQVHNPELPEKSRLSLARQLMRMRPPKSWRRSKPSAARKEAVQESMQDAASDVEPDPYELVRLKYQREAAEQQRQQHERQRRERAKSIMTQGVLAQAARGR